MLEAEIHISSTIPLTRLVDLLFDLSLHVGADVSLDGVGDVTRQALWLRWADEQDRLRIAGCLDRAHQQLANPNEIHQRLWAKIAALRPGREDLWDAQQRRIVELVDVTPQDHHDTRRLHPEADEGTVVPVPVRDSFLHVIAWRWLSSAYPGLAEPEHTLH